MENSTLWEPIVPPEHLETRKMMTRELKNRVKPDEIEFTPIQEEQEPWMSLLNSGMMSMNEAKRSMEKFGHSINSIYGSAGQNGAFGVGGSGGNGGSYTTSIFLKE